MEWAPRASSHHMELGFESSAPDMMISGNETLLREMLSNLLDNAISYRNPDTYGHITVELTNIPYPVLTIEDDGLGIPAHEIDKVFERFYRIPGSGGNGCGLGLAIVKEIADMHGIRLELTGATASSGTRVTLSFPERQVQSVYADQA